MRRYLSQIAEVDATGAIADVYRDIRTTLQIPIVNLVWRHLAVEPTMLLACWRVVRPLYVSGYCARGAQLLQDNYEVFELRQIPRNVLDAEVDAAGEAMLRRILATYIHANPLNLLALNVLVQRLTGVGVGESIALPKAQTQYNEEGELPVILCVDELAATVRTSVEALEDLGRRPGDFVVPSVFRHLAYWPGFLELALQRLESVVATETFDGLVARCAQRATRVACGLLSYAGESELPAEPLRSSATAVLRGFTEQAMPRVITLLALLQHVMPASRENILSR